MRNRRQDLSHENYDSSKWDRIEGILRKAQLALSESEVCEIPQGNLGRSERGFWRVLEDLRILLLPPFLMLPSFPPIAPNMCEALDLGKFCSVSLLLFFSLQLRPAHKAAVNLDTLNASL